MCKESTTVAQAVIRDQSTESATVAQAMIRDQSSFLCPEVESIHEQPKIHLESRTKPNSRGYYGSG